MPSTRPLLFLAGTLTLTAIHLSAASQVLLQSDSQSVNCPVTVYAQPRFSGGITLVQPSNHDRAGVHLHLEDPDGRAIRSAEVTLRGLAAIRGAQPASFASSTQPTQSFHVHSGAAPGALTANLWLAHATSIESISVTAIEYTDAPAWHSSRASSCIATPNGTLLLGSIR